jgi:Membrane bound beta barrel domain (DUF5777)
MISRIWAIAVFLLWSIPAFSMPQFLQAFRSDPFRNPGVDGCGTCHVSPQGGGPRNPFGQAFMANGERFSPLLRAQFPDRFVYPTSKVSDRLTIHFSDPDKKQIVTETDGMKSLVDVAATTVNGQPAGTAAAPAPPPPAVEGFAAAEISKIPVDAYSREGVFFGSNIVNLPDGKPLKAGEVDFLIGHRFLQDPNAAGSGGLWGLDSGAYITFGGRVGITDRISVGAQRSNFFRSFQDATPIELNGAFQISRQKDSVPITLQLRGGVEGSHNFTDLYRPFFQVVATRTFADRVSVAAVPTFAFNTRGGAVNDSTFLPTFGLEHKHTQALGIGVGFRFLPTASIVGEYIPRLNGFKGEVQDHPGLSVGLQKSTNRHTFELVVGRQVVMTTSEYAYQGTRSFRVGFNIFRRIR